MSAETETVIETTSAPVRAAPPARRRVALWDNARALLILLVVFGHAIETLRGTPAVDTVYDVVYSFHMPAFMLVSGWFAKSSRLSRKAVLGTARLAVTWLIAELAWIGIRALAGQHPVSGQFLVVPSWTLWFLVSLFLMRLVLPYLAQFRSALALTVAASLLAGLSSSIGTPFSASRTICLLPFFVLGWWVRTKRLGDAAWFRTPSVRLRVGAAAVVVVAVAVLLLLTRAPFWTQQALFWRSGYEGLKMDPLLGIAVRILLTAIAAALSGAILVLLPRRRGWYSVPGRNTMPIYLLHAPLIFLMRQLAIDDAIGTLPIALPVMLAIAAVLTILLGSPQVARVMRPITEPDLVFRAVGR